MPAGEERLLSWESFRQSIEAGAPAEFRLCWEPDVTVFVGGDGRRIGLLTPVSADLVTPPSPLVQVDLGLVTRADQTLLEIATDAIDLHEQFYAFLLSLTERFRQEGQASLSSLSETLTRWHELLRPVSCMSEDQQVGLLGELWMLERLMNTMGDHALDAWTGPHHESHDFRVGQNEFEVKTTRSTRRSHVINGLMQLVPSTDHVLWLVSLQYERAGAESGDSLPEVVRRVTGRLSHETGARERLRGLLWTGYRYQAEHALYYTGKFQLRTPAALVRVDDACPRITPASLAGLIGERAGRVDDVHYRINVDGLGTHDGSPSFIQILP